MQELLISHWDKLNAREANFCQVSNGEIQILVTKVLCGGNLDELEKSSKINRNVKTAATCVKILKLWEFPLTVSEIKRLHKTLGNKTPIGYSSAFALTYIEIKKTNDVSEFEALVDELYLNYVSKME